MKTIVRPVIIIAIIFAASSCFPGKKLADSNTVILPLTDTVKLRAGSVVYALPRTVFTIIVNMERTIEKPGPYAQFASDLLGLTDAIQNETESWEISSINVSGSREVDPSEYYVISGSTLFQTNVVALKQEGLILDLNPSSVGVDVPVTGGIETDATRFVSYDLGSDEYFQTQRDTAYKRVSIDSSFIRIPYIVEKKKMLTVDQLAEKAAKRLMELRDGKHLILTGEANVFPQNDAALNEINRIEKEYTELFSGKTFREIRSFTYQVIPEKEMIGKPVTLFRFSDATGPVAANAKDGKPVNIEFTPEQKTKKLTYIEKPQPELNSQRFDKLFYRVPDVVKIKISLGNESLVNSRRLIFQFGQVVQLPANYIIGK